MAIQSFLKVGFLSAVHLELLFMVGGLQPVTRAVRSPSFRNFVPKRDLTLLTSVKHGEFVVERDHGPPAEGSASFHTSRWTIVMKAAQSQAPGGGLL